MKITVFCLVLLAATAFSQLHLPSTEEILVPTLDDNFEMDRKAVLEFLGGVAEGLVHSLHFDDFAKCIDDDKKAAAHIKKAIQLFREKDAKHIAQAIAEIAEAIKMIPHAIVDCKAAVEDLKTLIQMIEEFANPGKFVWVVAKNLIIHGVEIYHHVRDGVVAYKGGKFHDSGAQFGEAIARIFFAAKPATSMAKVNTLNAGNKLWRATVHKKWEGMTLWDVKTRFLSLKSLRIEGIPSGDADHANSPNPAADFDSRTQWPNCVHPIRDQGRCGSCWAFGASEAVTDRFCIKSGGATNIVFSPQYEVSCDTGNMGCNGGWLNVAWKFLENKGIVTESCWPYKSGDGKVPKCNTFTKCEDGQPIKNYYIKKGSTKNYQKPASIKAEIEQNGPIETGFYVYEDFLDYKDGIYEHNSGSLLGGHAVKIIGWGSQPIKHWIAANSWDNDWGDQGFFKIGEGECNFDSQGIAGQADLDK